MERFENYDRARVEFYLSKSDVSKNKEVFDYLYSHKAEIDSVLGSQIAWERADESKYSRISVTLLDVSIETENDWSMMAKFQAEWSKRFYDILTPYVKKLF